MQFRTRFYEDPQSTIYDVARDSSLILFHAFISDIHCLNTAGSVSYYSPSLHSKPQWDDPAAPWCWKDIKSRLWPGRTQDITILVNVLSVYETFWIKHFLTATQMRFSHLTDVQIHEPTVWCRQYWTNWETEGITWAACLSGSQQSRVNYSSRR